MAPLVEIQVGKLDEIARAEAAAAGLQSVPDAIHLLIQHLAVLTDATGVVVDLERDGELISAFATSGQEGEVGRARSVSTSSFGSCFTTDQTLRTPNLHRDPRFPDADDLPPDALSMIGVPLHVHGATVGLVRVLSSEESRFDPEHVDIARLVTGSIARVLMKAVREEVLHRAPEPPAPVSPAVQARRFADRRRAEQRQADRYGYPVTVVRCRIEGYVTAEVLEMVPSLVRATDGCFRMDATEFAVLMPATSSEQASRAAERIRSQVEGAAEGVALEWAIRPEVGEATGAAEVA